MKQRKSNKYVQTWVSPEFKRKLKAEASMNGCSVFDYSQSLAQTDDDLKTLLNKSDKKLQKGWKLDF